MTIPLTPFMWCVAILPIVLLLSTMILLNWSASKAAIMALAIAVISALVVYQSSYSALLSESAKGLWNAAIILAVVWPAIFIHELYVEGNAYSAIKTGMEKTSRHELLQIIIFGWVFPSFLQGVTGFGVAVAVGAPLLVGIGVAPFWSVVIVLLCHSWGGTFGTLSIAWQALLTETQIGGETVAATALVACLIIWAHNFIGGFALCWFYGKGKALREGLPAFLLVSTIQGGGQLLLAQVNHTVACFLPACVSLLAVVLLSKTKKYGKAWSLADSRIMIRRKGEQNERAPVLTFAQSLFPYILLTLIAITVLLIPPVKALLSQWTIGFAFPETATGYGYITPAEDYFSPLTPFTFAGTILFITSVISYFFFKRKHSIQPGGLGRIFRRTLIKTIPSSIAITSLIIMSKILGSSGQIYVLAQGVVQVLGQEYIIVATLVGMFGSFITGSNMSSNILLGNFQMTTAKLLGLQPSSLLGAQTAGGVIGTSFAPGNIVLGTSTTGSTGQEGAILKKILPLAITLSVLSGLILFLLYAI